MNTTKYVCFPFLLIFIFRSAVAQQINDYQVFSQHKLKLTNARLARGKYPTDRFTRHSGWIVTLLESKRIQKEIDATKKQEEVFIKIKKARDKKINEIRMRYNWQNISEARTKQVAASISKINSQSDDEILSNLAEHQQKRIIQLLVWEQIFAHGLPRLLCQPAVSKTYGVDRNIRKQIVVVAEKLDKEIEKIQKSYPLRIRKALEKSLTTKQKKELKELIGENEIVKNWPTQTVNQLVRGNLLYGYPVSKLEQLGLETMPCTLRPQIMTPVVQVARRFSNKVFLISAPATSRELEITKSQYKAYRKLRSEFLAELREVEKINEPDPKKRQELAQRVANTFEKKVIEQILLPHQVDLLNKIYYWGEIQRNGLYISLVGFGKRAKLLKPESLGAALKITDEQIKELDKNAVSTAKELIAERNKLQRRFVFDFLNLLDGPKQQKLKRVLGEAPRENGLPDLTSIRMQLKFVQKLKQLR